jgi:putative DNA primase/helicase
MTYLRADDIHARIGAGWPRVLAQLGVDEKVLRKRNGPCPACGGVDRFTFDNRKLRGDFFCRGCGAGSGFDLLMRIHRWDFATARDRVIDAANLGAESRPHVAYAPPASSAPVDPARPPSRVMRLRQTRCVVTNCDDAVDYLTGRALWPLPADCSLRAHVAADYWRDGVLVGRFPALVTDVVSVAGELVTTHVTYLEHGRKLQRQEPRKLLSPLTGHVGCAARLMPAHDVLGVAEGIETALAAATLHDVPTWATLNASLLAKFEPPASVRRLVVFADRDIAGLDAATRLMQRLQGRVELEVRAPPAPAKDWNDVLLRASTDNESDPRARETA